MNTIAGLYYNIGKKKLTFDKHILFSGIIKALIICSMFIGTAYCFQKTDLSSIGVTPVFVMTSAITLYVGKSVTSLCKILGIELNTDKRQE